MTVNIFDGVSEQSGRIIIITSNHPQKLDSALIRPGRCDLKIELGYLTYDSTIKSLHHFYDKENEISIQKLINSLVNNVTQLSDDEFKEQFQITGANIFKHCVENIDDIKSCIHKIFNNNIKN